MMGFELKECPFCGSENATLTRNESARYEKFYYYVYCPVCGIRTRGEPIEKKLIGDNEWDNPAVHRSLCCWNKRAVKD